MSAGGQEFRPSQRLRTRTDFDRPRHLGFKAESAGFLFRLLPSPEGVVGRRLGIIASRRVGNAVVRNRAKRLFREIFRKNQEALPASCDVLLVVRASYAEQSYAELEERYLKACARGRRHADTKDQ